MLVEPRYYNKFKTLIKDAELSKDKACILNDDFILDRHDDLSLFYAAHNEYINENASVMVVGICPGYKQMYKSFQVVQQSANSEAETLECCKKESRLYGASRKNLVDMLIEAGMKHQVLEDGKPDVFFDSKKLFHTTSLVRYPIMVGANHKNYDGRKPDMIKNQYIYDLASQSIIYEVANLHNLQLIIPLGQSVEEFLMFCFKDNAQICDIILKGLPHPSGLNAHRPKIFEQNKDSLKKQIRSFYDRLV